MYNNVFALFDQLSLALLKPGKSHGVCRSADLAQVELLLSLISSLLVLLLSFSRMFLHCE
jgi:hypothetical protein